MMNLAVETWLGLTICYCCLLTATVSPADASPQLHLSAAITQVIKDDDEPTLLLQYPNWEHLNLSSSELPAPTRNAETIDLQVGMAPTLEVMEGVDVVWQIPPIPKEVLFIAHSLNGLPTEYFDWSPSCRLCTGLPEHRTIVLEALARGYAVIAIKSLGSGWMQFPLETNVDLNNVKLILASWRQRHGLESLPLSAFGSSMGGFFVTILAPQLRIYSQANMISFVNVDALKILDAKDYPPIVFVRMPQRTYWRLVIWRY
ncbi:hypothetical protein O6H91_11G066500 [Diphasiastrum complanatum]|uniref:Uncharacterized protein n=1 Tax=Diphasiastrum complanatum TaxID=34168 RepID=A0ACC2CAE8_DIPCM|nr:hypothetical protein O6H91_11G066500 [Diphasiastrum complanatum]